MPRSGLHRASGKAHSLRLGAWWAGCGVRLPFRAANCELQILKAYQGHIVSREASDLDLRPAPAATKGKAPNRRTSNGADGDGLWMAKRRRGGSPSTARRISTG